MALTEAERRVRESALAGWLTPLVILGIFFYVTWAMVSEVISTFSLLPLPWA